VNNVLRTTAALLCWVMLGVPSSSQQVAPDLSSFRIQSGGLELSRPTHASAFFDVVGRRAALFGYEGRDLEAWVYPIEIVDGLSLSFRLEGYPLDIDRDTLASISVRPEATTLVYAHSAFTVRQTMFAPLDEPGVVILLEVESVLPLSITASFRPRLRLMWPATSMSSNLSWDGDAHAYFLTEETNRFAGVLGSPDARDVSVMPYQEEPRDLPNRFVIDPPRLAGARSEQPPRPARRVIPIVITGSVEGRAAAKAAYDRILASIPDLYAKTADHYARLDRSTVGISTPEPRLDEAFRWAKVGIDKGVAANPLLGTGLIAGFRTAGDSERPGYAWYFGRDSAWTTLASTAAGAFDTTKTALEFLRKFQRDDGKIPHEISQSAALIPWFTNFGYPWASADATPLYVIANAEYWRATADRPFLDAAWASILKAYKFSGATDSDGNALIENTNVGHGWVEGGSLYPAHEEIYMQGLWVEALRSVEEMAERDQLDAVGDDLSRHEARAHAARAHRDAVGYRDRVELHRRPAGGLDAVLDELGERAQVEVARHRLGPRVRDADDRLGEGLVVVADALEVGACGRAVTALGERAGSMLEVLTGRHAGRCYAPVLCARRVRSRRPRTRPQRWARSRSSATSTAKSSGCWKSATPSSCAAVLTCAPPETSV